MSIQTAWLEAMSPTTGLDQLAVRTTAVRMYSHLVPGITNVTDRARYFSLHSYMIHYWAKRRGNDDMRAFYRTLRRAECLVGLADKLHDPNSYAVVGTRKIDGWLNRQGKLKPTQRVPVERLSDEYFSNGRGGFGQYYAGAETELGLITEIDGVVRLIEPRGKTLAEAFGRVAEKCDFDNLLEKPDVSAESLHAIGRELGFMRAFGDERRTLREILFAEGEGEESPGVRRRRSILLLLSLASAESGGLTNPNWDVLRAALHRRLPSGKRFACPKPLRAHLSLWRVYAMHEHFSFALETILSAAVGEVGEMEAGEVHGDIDAVAERMGALLSRGATTRFSELLDRASKGVVEDGAEDAGDVFDEASLRDSIEGSLADQPGKALATTIHLLARLSARVMGRGNPYAGLVEEGMFFEKGRLSLLDLTTLAETKAEGTCRELLVSLVRTVLATHLRVACAKLTRNRIYTYKVAYQNGRLTKVEATWPAFSSPRLQKAAQIAADVGLLKYTDGIFTITADGHQALERFRCE